MKKLLLSCFVAMGIASNAQNVVFQDSFDDYTDFTITNAGSWTLTDVDQSLTYGFQGITFLNTGVKKSFQVFNSTTTTAPMTPSATSNWSARTGTKAMVAFASTVPTNNDWMISPKIQLASDGGSLSFWAKSCDGTYGAENFRVYVSTTGTAVANFTPINVVQTTPADVTWHEYTYSLAAYAGQQVYIAVVCTSNDQFGFAVDDFKVTSTVASAATPACISANSPANDAVGVNVGAYLNWTASPYATSYDLYLDTNANPTTLIGNFTGTGYASPTPLTAGAKYYWKAVPKNAAGTATGCPVYSFTVGIPNPPGCIATFTPANAATGIAYTTTPLTWTAPTTGGTPTGYQVYFGTSATALSLVTTTAATTTNYNVAGTLPNTTYYWQIVPVNADGPATGCPVRSFTTLAVVNPFTPYCGPLSYTTVEPTTSVNFTYNTANTSATTVGTSASGQPAHQDFTSKVFKVEKGTNTTVSLNANTDGTSFRHYFAVFIDWNKDGDFNDANEKYFTTSTNLVYILGSNGSGTGTANQPINGTIAVPADAPLGQTRMRIKSAFYTSTGLTGTTLTNFADPCLTTGSNFGQVEEYTIEVVNAGTLAVSDVNKSGITVYPNPFTDILKISDVKGVKSVSVNDISGREVKSLAPSAELNLSNLKTGLYIVNLKMEDGSVKSFKAIKK